MSDLKHLAIPGAEFSLRVTPKARRNAVVVNGEIIRIHVTAAPEDGKANAAVVKLLASSLGVAKSRLIPVAHRSDSFRIPNFVKV